MISLFNSYSQESKSSLIILHTNDLHSNLTGFSPELEYSPCILHDDQTTGGFSRIAGIIAAEKEKNSERLLVLDAGDFLMGTFFHVIELETGFQLPLMKKMGYDVLALGNHEFDFGPDAFADIVSSSLKNGEIPLLTLSNLKFSKKQQGDKKFKDLYDQGIIKEYHILERNGLKIGIFGLIGIDADEVAPGKTPLEFPNYIKSARKTVKTLRKKENVDIVICLSHSGLELDEEGNWKGEDIKLAQKLKGIDVIISGHSHSKTKDLIKIGETIIVQGGSQGKYVGRLEINISDFGVSESKYSLIPVDDNIMGDCHIHKEIADQIRLIDKNLLRPMGLGYYLPVVATDYELVAGRYSDLNESNLGPFLADALYYYVNNHSSAKTDFTIIAAGVIRDDIKVGNHGVQIASDIFRVTSLGEGDDNIPGYPLARVFLTGKELKSLFEVLLIAPKISESNHCYFSGVKIFYDKDKGFLKKITKIEINGIEVDTRKKNKQLYAVVANSYMLEFVGMIKKMTFGILSVVPKHLNGEKVKNIKDVWIDFDENKEGIQEGKEWMAVLQYIKTFEDRTGNGVPDFPEKYREAIKRMIPLEK